MTVKNKLLPVHTIIMRKRKQLSLGVENRGKGRQRIIKLVVLR